MDFLVWRRKNKSLGHTQRECPRHNIQGILCRRRKGRHLCDHRLRPTHNRGGGENGFTFNPYKYTVDMRKLVGIILRNVMDKSNTDPNALTGKVCRLKNKKEPTTGTRRYMERNHAVYHWLVILGCTIAKKYMKERKEVKEKWNILSSIGRVCLKT